MTIRKETMVAKPTFFDPAGHVPDAQKYYKTMGETVGGWEVVRIFDNQSMTVTTADLSRLEVVADDVLIENDLTPLLGRLVRIKFTDLSSFKGVVRGVRHGTATIGGEEFRYPSGISLENDWYDFTTVESIEFL